MMTFWRLLGGGRRQGAGSLKHAFYAESEGVLITPGNPCGGAANEGPSTLPPAPTIQCSITYYRTWATTIYSYFLLLFVSLVVSVLDPIQQFTILARSCQLQSLVILSFFEADEMDLNMIGGRCWN